DSGHYRSVGRLSQGGMVGFRRDVEKRPISGRMVDQSSPCFEWVWFSGTLRRNIGRHHGLVQAAARMVFPRHTFTSFDRSLRLDSHGHTLVWDWLHVRDLYRLV